MQIDILTIFPRFFDEFLRHGMVRVARQKGRLDVRITDLRAYAEDRHRTVDGRPYGGGPGMLLKPEPVFRALDGLGLSVGAEAPEGTLPLLMCPRGQQLGQQDLVEFSGARRWIILCGRYEGYDERIVEAYPWRRVSLGDYVLSGGEVPAMAIIEGAARLLPGVLGDGESALRDSFNEWTGPEGLDHAHWTRPPEYRGRGVPEVLRSGDHGAIEKWRRVNSEQQGSIRSQTIRGKKKESASPGHTGKSPAEITDGAPYKEVPGEKDVEQDQ
ncbi:MAG: tRNA (guanosine(37)-N1)-methyltransferase TrmD [Planctomycetota bacterium]|nr:tRNA (guanosine(37)-N1)-methyltransferase TrmD [Planctomycetota bacterium]